MTTRPWELAPTEPWEGQQPIYNRVVSVRRPNNPLLLGNIGYGGLDPVQETIIASNLPAVIELHQHRGRPEAGLPGDMREASGWRIFVPVFSTVAGQIVERDVVVDDLGRRFVAIASDPSALGFEIYAEQLES